MKPTIVTLESSDETPIVVSYEEAFGEFSEVFGRKARARRKKRRLERITNRRDVKRARREARQEKRMGRIQNRQERRGARREGRRARMEERQARRSDRMRLRQGRRTERKQMRLERRQLGQEDDAPVEDGGATSEPQDDGGSMPPPPPRQDDGGYDDGGYTPPNPVAEDDGSQGGGYAGEPPSQQSEPVYQEDVTDYGSGGTGIYDDGSYGGSEDSGDYGDAYDSESVDSETGESDEESGFTGDLGFDGIIEMSPEDAQWNEYFSSAEGVAKINPIVSDTARKIEQNKEAICVMQEQCNRIATNDPASARKIQGQIEKRQAILSNLESDLANYCKFDGDYSEARGGRKAVSKRKAEVRQAKKLARQERKAVRKARRQDKKLVRKNAQAVKRANKRAVRSEKRAVRQQKRADKQIAKAEVRQGRRGLGLGVRRRPKSLSEVEVTEVDEDLNPEFGEESIVIPAEEVANFVSTNVQTLPNQTGLIGLDAIDDYDAPETRQFDLKFSNADGGSGSKIDIKSIAIGVGVGILAIYLVKKFTK